LGRQQAPRSRAAAECILAEPSAGGGFAVGEEHVSGRFPREPCVERTAGRGRCAASDLLGHEGAVVVLLVVRRALGERWWAGLSRIANGWRHGIREADAVRQL